MCDKILLRVAKTAILSRFNNDYILDKEHLLKEYPFLKKDGAVFVTLKYNNELRGCIGSIVPHKILLDDLISNAISAGFNDPRFDSLSEYELPHLSLEVSVLSEPVELEYSDYEDLLEKVRPNIDGLILKHERFQGTFLPQVWEQLPSPKLFLEHLSIKAGSSPLIYEQHPTIYRYEVEHIQSGFDEILPL